MAERKYHLHDGKKGAALAVRITPRARENQVVEILSDGTVRIRLAVQPVENELNTKLTAFLAEVLGVSVSAIEIVAGQKGRDKLVSILNMDADTVHQIVLKALSKSD
jgi:hypothetical protein